MEEKRVLRVKKEIMAENVRDANAFRLDREKEGCLFVDVMASPGAGKTSLLIALIERLRKSAKLRSELSPEIGVIEADLESDVDSLKMKKAGISSVEINTKGICHVDMDMVKRGFDAFGGEPFNYVFLENIGNLICPAEFDTGAHLRVMLLSVPEGYDKVYKYPPMFAIADALIVTKSDYLPLNEDFEMGKLMEAARVLNPSLNIFVSSARTGEGISEIAAWIEERRQLLLRHTSRQQ